VEGQNEASVQLKEDTSTAARGEPAAAPAECHGASGTQGWPSCIPCGASAMVAAGPTVHVQL
jgi:hypothetical protein